MTIKAEEKELKQIFSDDYFFEIPSYQRPYAWTTEQTGELLDDITVAMDEALQEYFLGSIVLIKDMDEPLSQVVDGQQRLTTLTILLCVLRELSEDEGIRNDLEQFICEKGNKLKSTEDRFRLSFKGTGP